MPSQFEREFRRDMLLVGGAILLVILVAGGLIGWVAWAVVRSMT